MLETKPDVVSRIETADLVHHRLFLASPQYGGMCHTIFARSLSDLSGVCAKYGVPFRPCFYLNESFIPRARNYCADTFLESGAEHLLFVDSDIGFKPEDAIELLVLQAQNPQFEVIGAAYKKKALDAGYTFNNEKPFDAGSTVPVEVRGIGTGFMMIRREVFVQLAEAFPQFKYTTDDDRPPFDGKEIMQFFTGEIDPVSRRYLTEDYWFSRRCEDIGIRTWLCPWMRLQHAGTFIFE